MSAPLFLSGTLDEALSDAQTDHAIAAYRARADYDRTPPLGRRSFPPCSGDTGVNASMPIMFPRRHDALADVLSRFEGVHHQSFVIQTCGHTPTRTVHGVREHACPHEEHACRETTAIVVSSPSNAPASEANIAAANRLGARSGIPVVAVSYDPRDSSAPVTVRLDGAVVARSMIGARNVLSEAHLSHAESSHHRDCSTRGAHVSGKNADAFPEPFRHTLRRVPGARHMLVDTALFCDSCGEIVTVLDFRSWSEVRRRNRLAYTVSLGRAARVPTILVEHDEDQPFRRGVRTLIHANDEMNPEADVHGSVYDLAGMFYEVYDGHHCNVGGR